MVLSVFWLVNEPVYEIRFHWNEVESVTSMRWSWSLRGGKVRLWREVVEGNRRRSFYVFEWGKSVSLILDFAVAHGVRVPARAERYEFLWRLGE